MSRSIGNGEESLLWWHYPGIPERAIAIQGVTSIASVTSRDEASIGADRSRMVFHSSLIFSFFPTRQVSRLSGKKILMDSSFLIFYTVMIEIILIPTFEPLDIKQFSPGSQG